jgi:hypothetical protein
MLTDKAHLLKLLGLRPTGDLGPYTIYTSKRRATVAFPRSPPMKPPSPKQTLQRHRWKASAAAWANLPQPIRDDWEHAAKRAHITITGHNLFMWFTLAGDRATIQTIEHQSSIHLITPKATEP